jgi:peptidoglycan/LPS O-acetylase OafA/YrhL
MLRSLFRLAWSAAALVAGIVTIQALLLLSAATWASPWLGQGIPASRGGLTVLLALELVAGILGAFVAVLAAPARLALHALVFAAAVTALNAAIVFAPDGPWPLWPGVVVVATVPATTWIGYRLAIALRKRRPPHRVTGEIA